MVWNIWFYSYLQNRHQSVKIKDTLSDKVTLSYGVPLGSVLGPVLFTLYTTPFSAITFSFDINHHLYADDTQIYMSLSVSNAKQSLEKLQHCLTSVSAWMTGSKLKLNPSKTEFLLIGTKLQREKILNNFPCLILGQATNPSASAKNLGVLFDSNLNFRKHISQTCRACFYHIRDLRRIRKKSVFRSCQQIAMALVSSKLDYCNSLFHNMPGKDIARLQRVQNCLARVVTKAPRFSRSVPILKRLHWQHSGNYLNRTYLTWLFYPSPSAARLPADEPALASIMTHDHAEDIRAIEVLLIDQMID